MAIVVDGQAVGSIGLKLGTDVERVSSELGYWLGAPYRGRGVMTEAIRAFTDDSFERFSLTRIFALPFAHNEASCRALEKAGFTLEGDPPAARRSRTGRSPTSGSMLGCIEPS